MEMPHNKREAFYYTIGIIQQTFKPFRILGRLEPKGERQVQQGLKRQRKIQRKRSRDSPRWVKDLLQVQPGKMQLSEMQICSFVQQVFQKGTQCHELQGRQAGLGYNRFSLTEGTAAQQWRGHCVFKANMQGPLHFFR